MKALILAAGFGSRLAPITNDIPKSLVEVNGKSILFKQIENLHENGITDITIISGYKGDILENRVHEKYPEINIIRSIDYQNTNNMYSAYLAKDVMKGNDFLMMNADVFFDSSVIEALLAFSHENAIVTDIGTYYEESMKVIENNGRLIKISKKITEDEALGASIDVYKFSAKAGEAFFNKCHEYIDEKKELKLWSEIALNDILSEVEFRACPLVGRWVEIDNHDDLNNAIELFKEETKTRK
jgi:choline kinase